MYVDENIINHTLHIFVCEHFNLKQSSEKLATFVEQYANTARCFRQKNYKSFPLKHFQYRDTCFICVHVNLKIHCKYNQ
jgi:hypothetical protein